MRPKRKRNGPAAADNHKYVPPEEFIDDFDENRMLDEIDEAWEQEKDQLVDIAEIVKDRILQSIALSKKYGNKEPNREAIQKIWQQHWEHVSREIREQDRELEEIEEE